MGAARFPSAGRGGSQSSVWGVPMFDAGLLGSVQPFKRTRKQRVSADICHGFGINDPTVLYGGVQAGGPRPTTLFGPVLSDSGEVRAWLRLASHESRHAYASFMIAASVNAKALFTPWAMHQSQPRSTATDAFSRGSEGEAAALLDAYLDGE